MHCNLSCLCHAGDVFKMSRPLQGFFFFAPIQFVNQRALSYSTTIFCSRWDFMIDCVWDLRP